MCRKNERKGSIIGGEGNGGIIFPELHYGRDALVGIALFLTHLAKFEKPVGFLRKKYPNYFIAKKKIELEHGTNVDGILEKIQKKYSKYDIDSRDGVKIHLIKNGCICENQTPNQSSEYMRNQSLKPRQTI